MTAARLYPMVFFLAGAPALIYQVVWQRVLGLHFGVDIFSAAITVSAFMAGLGLGALAGGRLADEVRHPGRWYAAMELLIGLYGMFSLALFDMVGSAVGGGGGSATLATDFALLLLPTTAMGATFPLMCRAILPSETSLGQQVSRLYALNTLGAALGAILATYLLIGGIGLDGAVRTAVVCNVLVAGLVGTVAWQGSTPPAHRPPAFPRIPAEILGFAFLSGLLALTYELVWYRILGTVLHASVYVFGTVLALYLCGLGLGSWRARHQIDTPGALERFAWCQLGISAYVLGTLLLLRNILFLPGFRGWMVATVMGPPLPSPQLVTEGLSAAVVSSFLNLGLWGVVLMGVPVFLMGYGFPQLLRAGAERVSELGRATGTITFANIVGSTLAGLLTGLVLLRAVGSEVTLIGAASLGLLVPLWVFRHQLRRSGWLLAAASLALAALMLPGHGQLMQALHLANHPGVDFVGVEDHTGVTTLRRHREVIAFEGERSFHGSWLLTIDGNLHGGFHSLDVVATDPDFDLALTAHPAPRRVLSIGLGDGKIAWSALSVPTVEELVIVELSQGLPEVLRHSAQGRAVLDDDRVSYHVADGRHWLAEHPDERFDVILMWPLHAMQAYYGNLYSLEFLHTLRHHLRPEGLLIARTEDVWASARTITEPFADVIRLGSTTYVASEHPIRLSAPDGVEADRELIRQATTGVALNRDLRPHSEYYLTYPHPLASHTPPYALPSGSPRRARHRSLR